MKKRAVAHNFIGGISNFLFLFLTSLVLLPYYFKFISTSDYGIWLGGISFLSLVSVLEANIGLILTQQLGEKWVQKKIDEFSFYFTAALWIGTIISLLIIFLSYFFKNKLCLIIIHEQKELTIFAKSFFFYAASLAITIVSSYINSITQVFLKTLIPPLFNIFSSIIGITYTVLLVPHQGVLAIALGNLIRSFVYGSLISIYVFGLIKKNKIVLGFRLEYVQKLLGNIGFPFFSKVGMTVASNMQNFIIAASISASATTIFDITRKLPIMSQTVINIISASTFTSFSLYYAEQKKSDDKDLITNNYFTLMKFMLIGVMMTVVLLGQNFINLWVGPDKFGGNLLLGVLCILALSDQIRLLIAQQYYARGKFNLTAKTDLLFVGAFIFSAFILIPLYRLYGIVLAGIAANVFYYFVCFFFEKKESIVLIPYVIDKVFMLDVLFALLLTTTAKFIIKYLSLNLLYSTFFSLLIIAIMFFYQYVRKRDFFAFLLHNILKK